MYLTIIENLKADIAGDKKLKKNVKKIFKSVR